MTQSFIKIKAEEKITKNDTKFYREERKEVFVKEISEKSKRKQKSQDQRKVQCVFWIIDNKQTLTLLQDKGPASSDLILR